MDVAVVIPVLNQLSYTVQCLESLARTGVSGREVVVINNGSTDGTAEFLQQHPELRVISNPQNLGCSAAWNQGVEAAHAEWTIVLNNDVIVAPGFREGLLAFAAEAHCDIVSPAMGEGELDYDLPSFSKEFLAKMGHRQRAGLAFGVCFMVHRRVFETIGLFDTKLGQAGYEDEDFFRRARAVGFRLGTTGRAYLHHFGSVTQKMVKAARPAGVSGPLGNRDYFRQKHHLNWLRRRTDRLQGKVRWGLWRWRERRQSGLTLIMRRAGGQWQLC
jgi:N-acetylglucosaminyl-diphospho-decaprenol L-rhamnosyltransferase